MATAGNPSEKEIRGILELVKTVAVVGASTNPEKEAHAVPAFLQSKGYRIVPVNPGAKEIFGEQAYPSLDDLPPQLATAVDVVNLFRPGDQVGPHVEKAIAMKVPVVWLQEGIENEAWAAQARAAGLTVIQNLCMKKAYQSLMSKEGNS